MEVWFTPPSPRSQSSNSLRYRRRRFSGSRIGKRGPSGSHSYPLSHSQPTPYSPHTHPNVIKIPTFMTAQAEDSTSTTSTHTSNSNYTSNPVTPNTHSNGTDTTTITTMALSTKPPTIVVGVLHARSHLRADTGIGHEQKWNGSRECHPL